MTWNDLIRQHMHGDKDTKHNILMMAKDWNSNMVGEKIDIEECDAHYLQWAVRDVDKSLEAMCDLFDMCLLLNQHLACFSILGYCESTLEGQEEAIKKAYWEIVADRHEELAVEW